MYRPGEVNEGWSLYGGFPLRGVCGYFSSPHPRNEGSPASDCFSIAGPTTRKCFLRTRNLRRLPSSSPNRLPRWPANRKIRRHSTAPEERLPPLPAAPVAAREAAAAVMKEEENNRNPTRRPSTPFPPKPMTLSEANLPPTLLLRSRTPLPP